jgi:hypothetical protein
MSQHALGPELGLMVNSIPKGAGEKTNFGVTIEGLDLNQISGK